MRILLFVMMLFFSFSAMAESETQSDWQGGPGVMGPVTDWGDSFYISGDMDWDTEPGQLKLIVNRSENQIASTDNPVYVISIDMDFDGDLDAVSCSYTNGEVFWSENNGPGTSFIKHSIGSVTSPRFVTAADYDNNGLRDVAVSSGADNKIVAFMHTPSGWASGTAIVTDFDARQIRSDDINGDDLIDIVGVSSYSGDVCWWRNNGSTSSWDKHYIDGALLGAYTCDVGDFNNDGHPDVVAASNSANDICAYISKSPYGYSWTRYNIETSYNNPVSISAADFNNDGNDDFAIASSYSDGNLRWYDFLDTQSSWTYHEMNGAEGSGIYDIVAHDMDGDGYPDLTAASSGDNRIVWCKNREYLGEDWETFAVSEYFGGALGVSVGDMDGDGVPDVLGCAYNGDKVSWWRVSGFTTPSILTSSIVNIEPPDPGMVNWDYIHWAYTLPDETSIMFRLRTSYNSSNMGTYSSWLTEASNLGSVVAQGGQYVQYQARLATNNPNVTPSLKDITVLWNGYGIEDETSAPIDGRKVWLSSGNPVSGAFSVGYRIEQAGPVNIAVYDVTGRTVFQIGQGEMAAGEYSAMVSDLPAGSYAVVMQSEEGMASQRVVVIP